MDVEKMKLKKNMLAKAWDRCKSLGNSGKNSSVNPLMKKSKSCHIPSSSMDDHKKKNKVAPEGCFSVYVGSERQRFVIKTELVNHPLFKMLLEDAELEYGFNSEGPLLLPCDVDLFYKVLAEMDDNGDDGEMSTRFICSFGCSPSRHRLSSRSMNKGYGSYKALCSSPMIKLNSC
ncbi:auxin-responsive protein SAUR50 [Gossypium arboreum]|uniref:auxin-responsive protein SAUR50 n=1 Tax=Gossypium arboreum TaxID=29729 RepID=UPI0008193706|nr:auxin-responsive protein SAUR50 [Gossypium arboreum]